MDLINISIYLLKYFFRYSENYITYKPTRDTKINKKITKIQEIIAGDSEIKLHYRVKKAKNSQMSAKNLANDDIDLDHQED